MKYAINGFFAGLVTGGTCFLIDAYPTTEVAVKHKVSREHGFFLGTVVGIAILGCLAAILCRG